MRKILAIIVCGLMFSTLFAKEKSPKFGIILFPTKGNINFEEGTFESWFCLNYSFSEGMLGEKSHVSPMTVMQIIDKKGRNLSDAYTSIKNKRSGALRPGMSLGISTSQDRKYNDYLRIGSNVFAVIREGKLIDRGGFVFGEKTLPWKKGDWHYIAFSWKKIGEEYEISISIDGSEKKTKTYPIAEDVDLSQNYDNLISIGSPYGSWGTINSFKISNKVLTQEEISESYTKGLSKDEATLLFQDGKSLKKLKKQNLSIKKIPKISKKGLILGKVKFVDGKFGKALKLVDK